MIRNLRYLLLVLRDSAWGGIAAIATIIALLWSVIFTLMPLGKADPTVPANTSITPLVITQETKNAAETTTSTPSFSIQQPVSWCGNKNGEFTANPGEFIIGDIVIDEESYSDARDYREEGTIAYFERSAQVLAKHGAGAWCGDISNFPELISNEFSKGCGGNGCNTIRQVVVRSGGTIEQSCLAAIDQNIPCPATSIP